MDFYTGNGVRLIFDSVCESVPTYTTRGPIARAADAVRLLQEAALAPLEREALFVILLDARHRAIAAQVVSVGDVASCGATPRSLFRSAVAANASSIILCHNHPTGVVDPSPEDQALTDRVRTAGTLLGIPLLDHVIVGAHSFYSFADSRTHPFEVIS